MLHFVVLMEPGSVGVDVETERWRDGVTERWRDEVMERNFFNESVKKQQILYEFST